MIKHTLILTAFIMLSACNKKGDTQLTPPIAQDYTRAVTATSSKWISAIVDFTPAPGQFVNTSTANADTPKGLIGKKGMVSLGGYGGSITFMFDHTVLNQNGVDFVVHGNSMDGGSEPGVVMVSVDKNGNGKADDEWYELKGEDHSLVKGNYTITYTRPARIDTATNVSWIDSDGVSGLIPVDMVSAYHKQCFYPLFLDGNPAQLKLTGSLLPFNGVKDTDGMWRLNAYKKGYVDNFSEDYLDKIGSDSNTERSNKFDLDNAIDKDGKAISLKGIDFVKVICAINGQAGWLGEVSTEVCGAISLSVR